jgi:hypothetical protein
MILQQFLIKNYDFPKSVQHITILDFVPIFTNWTEYVNQLCILENDYKNNLTRDEQIIIEYETSPFRYLYFLISSNHIDNSFGTLYGLIYGLAESDDLNILQFELVDCLYNKRYFINLLAEVMIRNFANIINNTYDQSDVYNLKLFYTIEMIDKLYDSISLKKIKPKSNNTTINDKLNQLWLYYLSNAIRLRNYLKSIRYVFESESNRKIWGMSNFNSDFYMWVLSYRTGIYLKSKFEIDNLYNWTKEYLDSYAKQMKKTIKFLYKINDNSLMLKDLIQLIKSDQSYDFKSADEMTKLYETEINNQHLILIDCDLPQTAKCGLKTFSNPHFSQAYYTDNNFYLNTHNWKLYKTYEIRTLTMHEAYPGHHLQIDIAENFSTNGYLAKAYPNMFCSFVEGWALFSESIRPKSTSMSDVISDIGQFNDHMMRILRIIADIDIHLNSKSPNEIIQFMSNYMLSENDIIQTEVLRYVAHPGQACSYKIGECVFMRIYNKYKTSTQINSKFMWNIYKKILLNGPSHLQTMLNDHNLKFNLEYI